MIKVKDGYAKLIGTTYKGSANRVLLSNGGDIEKAVASTANTLVLRDSTGSILHTVGSNLWITAAKGQGVAINIPNTGYYALSRIKSKTGNFTLSCHSAEDNKFVIGYMTDETVAAGTNALNKTWVFDGDTGIFSGGRIDATRFVSTVATGTQPYLCTSTTLNTNLNADLLDGVHLAGHGGKEGVMRSWKRGTYTTVNQYFGNGNVVVIDPKPTDDSTLSNNTIIFSLGDSSIRNTLLAFMYERDEIKYRRVVDGPTWGAWRTIAFTDSDLSGTAAYANILKSNSTTSVSAGLLFYAGWIPQGNTNNRSWCSPTGNYTNNSVKGEYGSIIRVNYGNTYYNELFFDVNSTRPSWRKITGTNSTGWKTLGLLEDIRPSGFVTSDVAGLSSYWGKLWEATNTVNYSDVDITFYIHSAYNSKRGFIHIKVRRSPVTTDGVTTYNHSVNMVLISGNIPTSEIRLYHDAATGKMELWLDVKTLYGVYNAVIISCTTRTTQEIIPILGTLYSNRFTTALTLPTYSYITLSNLNSHQIHVLLHTTNNTEYPLVWSNLTNGNQITADLLFKSYSHLTYNPHLKRITASVFKAGNSFYRDDSIELYGETPYIDFHYNNSTEDFTNRIIEGLAGQLTVTGKFRIGLAHSTSTDYNFYVNGTSYMNSTLTMNGAIVAKVGSSLVGIKFGSHSLNSLDNQLIWQSPEAIRFGSTDWNWDSWAGLKYNPSNKIIYLGLADGTIFNANSAQSGGKVYFPGVSNLYTGNGANLVWHAGNDGSGSGLDADLLDGLHGSYYAAASSLSNYLPLAGGTMQSTASIYWRDRGAFGDTEATYPYRYGGLKWTGTSDYVYLYAEEYSRDTLKLVLNFGDDANPTFSIRQSGTEVAYIGANGKFYGSNYQSYVATGTQPYACSSTTLNTNLNSDLLDGIHANGLLTGLSSGTTNKVSITVGGTTKNITTLYASYLCSVGTVNPLTGRNLAYGNVYSYNTNVNYHEGAPTTYTSVIGFGRGAAGTVEICGEWTSGRGLWVRALRDYEDDWYAWDRILTEATYAKVLDSRYHLKNNKISRIGGSYNWYAILQYNSSDANPSYYVADCAIINITSYTGWQPWIRAVDSEKGSWTIGQFTTSFHIGYIPKTNTTNNLTRNWKFDKDGSLSCPGNVVATHFYESSDINLKTNIKNILTSDNIPELKEFDWKKDGSHSYGLIAQELEELGYSELVSTNKEGYKTVNYSAALSLIVGKLQVKIRELEKEIKILKENGVYNSN